MSDGQKTIERDVALLKLNVEKVANVSRAFTEAKRREYQGEMLEIGRAMTGLESSYSRFVRQNETDFHNVEGFEKEGILKMEGSFVIW
jgi:hypothetical protein